MSTGPDGQREVDHDLIVIGCGAAGLAGAVAFVEAGGASERVLVLERAPRDQRGGSTAWTTAYLSVTRDAQLTPQFRDYIEAVADGGGNTAYLERFEEETPTTLGWIRNHGIETARLGPPAASPYDGPWVVQGGGRAIVDNLCEHLEQSGVEIRYETAAEHLLTDDGAVVGVVANGQALRARHVLIACGGFEGSPEMLAEHVGADAATMPLVAPGPRANRGDGIRMAVVAGAAVDGRFDRFHGEPVDPRSPDPEALIMGYPYGIVVNRAGRRFVDEGEGPSSITFELLADAVYRRADQEAWFVFDQRAWDTARPLPQLLYTSEPAIRGDSVEELASAAGIDPAGLAATITDFNAAVDDSVPYDWKVFDGRGTRGLEVDKSNWALALDTPPYAAYPVACAICFTYGGLRVDGDARVLDASGGPLPGLLAAGEVTGIFHERYPGGTSVLRSLTFGRIAGMGAAAG